MTTNSNSNFTESNLHLPYIAYIPYRVQIDETIPDSAKIYFGQISGLCVKYGYCWATDADLAQAKNTSIENIKRWNKQLEDAGYIRRETKNVPIADSHPIRWIKKRKIYVDQAFANSQPDSKKDCEGVKNDTSYGGVKNDTSYGGVKNDTYTNITLRDNSKQQPEQLVVVVPSSLHTLKISESLKLKISEANSKEEIDLAVKRCTRWKGKSNDEIGILTALNKSDSWVDNPSQEEKQQTNGEYLEKLRKLDGTSIGPIKITVGKLYIEFSSTATCVHFSIEKSDFIKNVTDYLENLRSKIYKKNNNKKTNEQLEAESELEFAHFNP